MEKLKHMDRREVVQIYWGDGHWLGINAIDDEKPYLFLTFDDLRKFNKQKYKR